MESYIKQGDCLELMKEIPDGSVDMILCDLPYGTTRNKWDSVIPLEPLWEQFKRVAKENAAIVLFAQTPFDKVLGASNLDMLKYEWIWEKDNGTGFLNAKKMPLKIHENLLVFYRKPPVYHPQMRTGFKPYTCKSGKPSGNYGDQVSVVTENSGDRYPVDLLRFPRDKDKLHPTQKPVGLCEYQILTYTNPGDVVFDATMGSGTSCVAAVNTGRKYIGFEKGEDNFLTARTRIEEAEADAWLL